MISTLTDARSGTRIRAVPIGRRQGGFTLVEVMISAGISTMVLAAILSSFLMMGRSEANLTNYSTMEQEARRGLERFSQDARMASAIVWTDSTRVTLTVPHMSDSGTDTVVYYWEGNTTSPNYQCFLRSGPDPITNVSGTTALIRNVESFQFNRWMIGSTGEATNDVSTKQLQIHLTIRRTSTTVVAATNLVISARYILRNKA
ncbi:MAG: prepilin-type N-terminal cleavage/methylation domain-containing protein [Opitutaceae bacterium]|nr:prepilin-type N-terminal cleavage/methylation domain-containing protein [Opitutaceae bacterium]